MADKSFERASSLGSSLKNYMFEFDIVGAPIDTSDFPLLAQSIQTPSKEFSEITRDFGQHTIREPGRTTKDGTIDLSLKVQRDMYVVEQIEAWMNAISDNQSGAGSSLDEVTGTGILYMLDDRSSNDGNELAKYELKMMFPQSKDSIDFEEGGEDPINLNVTFAYSSYSYETLGA